MRIRAERKGPILFGRRAPATHHGVKRCKQLPVAGQFAEKRVHTICAVVGAGGMGWPQLPERTQDRVDNCRNRIAGPTDRCAGTRSYEGSFWCLDIKQIEVALIHGLFWGQHVFRRDSRGCDRTSRASGIGWPGHLWATSREINAKPAPFCLHHRAHGHGNPASPSNVLSAVNSPGGID